MFMALLKCCGNCIVHIAHLDWSVSVKLFEFGVENLS